MLTAGAVYAQPDENPAGSSAAASSRRSGRRCAHGGRRRRRLRHLASRAAWCTPADGSSASAPSTSQARPRPRVAPVIGPAAHRTPDRARRHRGDHATAVPPPPPASTARPRPARSRCVKPTTPAPTTTMSTAAMNSTVQDPPAADGTPARIPRLTRGSTRPVLRVPAAPVGSRPDQGERCRRGRSRRPRRAVAGQPGSAAGVGVGRVVVPDGDGRLRAGLGPGLTSKTATP